MKNYRIAVIAGDGIGKEVIPAGIDVLNLAAEHGGFRCEFTPIPWGCDYYLQHGRMMDDGRGRSTDEVRRDLPRRDRRSEGGRSHLGPELILPLRQRLGQYVNLRPMRLLPGISSPLAGRSAADIDMVCVRENSEGEYCGIGGRLHRGTPDELAEQTGVFTRHGIERIARYAFKLAPRGRARCWRAPRSRTRCSMRWCCGTKWSPSVAKEFPDVELTKYHVDALCARMVTHPQTLDVIVASNLFGDILTDIGSAISGSLGVAPGGNINPERTTPSMFEPIHGSAPDIAGKGIANPIAAIWAGAMMLDHLGERAAHDRILAAIESVLADERVKTPDLGGRATTADMTRAVTAAMTTSRQPAVRLWALGSRSRLWDRRRRSLAYAPS